jgi:hypothetical protein
MTEAVRGGKITSIFLNLSADVRRIDKFIRKVPQFYDEKAEGSRRRRFPVPRKKVEGGSREPIVFSLLFI